jgi:pimeloyl-ACP methyl ester carboxylesterase
VNKTIDHRSRPIYYREEGEGFPVLLIHGLTEDHSIWDGQVASLQQDYRVLIPDLPGSGQSPLPAGAPSIDALADAVKAV